MCRALRLTTHWILLLVLCVAFVSPTLRAQAGGDVAVVVHSGVPVDDLSINDLRRMVLGDRTFWPGGMRITLLIRAPIAHERYVLLNSLCQMSEAQFRQHWIAKVFRAETPLAPKVISSNEVAMEMVNRFPGAITFVDASQVNKSLKVMKIDGRSPGEKGYALR